MKKDDEFVLARQIGGHWIYASKRSFKSQKAADSYRRKLSWRHGTIFIIKKHNYRIYKSLREAYKRG